jgi:hypothetical protein
MIGALLKNLFCAMLLFSLIALVVSYFGDYLIVYQKEQLRLKNPLRFNPHAPVGKRFRSE